MPGLHALTYVSEARQLLSRPQIDHLLERARERNAQEALTGVLLYTNGLFMQYLEGPETGLLKIWAVIQADPLHHRIDAQPIERIWIREFSQWSMAFRSGNGAYGMSHPMHLDKLLSGRLSQYGQSTSESIRGLLDFWNEYRGLNAF
jgi:Sensors of blue-light using FAD